MTKDNSPLARLGELELQPLSTGISDDRLEASVGESITTQVMMICRLAPTHFKPACH